MQKKIDLVNGPIDSTLRKFTIPIAFSFIIHMVYALVDMYYVSFLGEDAIAAMGASERIWFFIFAIGSGFAVGTGVIVARRIGEGNKEKANQTTTQAVSLMFVVAIALAILLSLFINEILSVLNISGVIQELAYSYLTALSLGIPFHFMVFQANAIIRSSGNSMYPMMILIVSNVINAIVTPLLIFGIGPFPELGIFGAALGTSIAQFLGSIIAFYILLSDNTPVKLTFKKFKVDLSVFYRILKVGIPASLQLIIVSINSIVIMRVCTEFGEDVLTTYMMGIRVDLLVYMSIFATGASMEIISGQNLGAGKIERIFKYFRSGVKQLSLILFGFGLAVFFGGQYFGMIFTDDAAIIGYLKNYLRITAFTYIPFAIGILSIRIISGAGAYFKSLLIVGTALIGIQIPAILLLAFNTPLGELGIWFGILISHYSFSLVAFLIMKRKSWLSTEI